MIRHFVKNNDCSANIQTLYTAIPPGETSFCVTVHEKAKCLNYYSASISLVNDEHASLPEFSRETQNCLTQIRIQEREIEEIICALNNNKASGPDAISHKMLKGVAKEISKLLATLFRYEVNSFSSQFVLKSIRSHFCQLVLILRSIRTYRIVLWAICTHLVNSYSFWSIRSQFGQFLLTQKLTNYEGNIVKKEKKKNKKQNISY